MKSIKDWLSELPEPYRTQALENLEKSKWGYSYTKVDNLGIALDEGFSWSASDEGNEYWANISVQAHKGHFSVVTNALSAIHAIALKKGFPAEEIMGIEDSVVKDTWNYKLKNSEEWHYINLSNDQP